MGDDGKGTEQSRDLLAFPARVHIKVIGAQGGRFAARVQAIVARHVAPAAMLETSTRPSRGGKYISVTVSIHADTRAQVDAIYRELSACDDVLIAL
jgi:hypothetical protein